MFPAAAFAGLAFSMISILQSMGQFTVPAMISLFPNVLMIGYLLLFNEKFGVKGLAVVFLLAWLMQVLVQIPFIRQKKFIYTPSVSFNDPGIKRVSKMVLPILVSSWVTPVSLFILAAFASYMGEGAVTSIRLSNRLYLILAGIFVFAMMNYLFPLMSRQSEDTDKSDFMNTYRRAFESLCFFIIPLSAAAFILSPNIISVLYERGEFTARASKMMAVAFSGFTPAIFGYSLYEITTKAYYAGKKVIVPTLLSIATLASTLTLSFVVVFATDLGIGFVSLSFSISILIASVIMAALFNKSHKGSFNKRSMTELLRGIVGTALMTFVLYIFTEYIFVSTRIVSTLLTAIMGSIAYILAMALMKSPTFMYYYEWIREKVVKN
jgi:murein biosynthesis integral membrane protein MurJ